MMQYLEQNNVSKADIQRHAENSVMKHKEKLNRSQTASKSDE
jgi:hypothetical protein